MTVSAVWWALRDALERCWAPIGGVTWRVSRRYPLSRSGVEWLLIGTVWVAAVVLAVS